MTEEVSVERIQGIESKIKNIIHKIETLKLNYNAQIADLYNEQKDTNGRIDLVLNEMKDLFRYYNSNYDKKIGDLTRIIDSFNIEGILKIQRIFLQEQDNINKELKTESEELKNEMASRDDAIKQELTKKIDSLRDEIIALSQQTVGDIDEQMEQIKGRVKGIVTELVTKLTTKLTSELEHKQLELNRLEKRQDQHEADYQNHLRVYTEHVKKDSMNYEEYQEHINDYNQQKRRNNTFHTLFSRQLSPLLKKFGRLEIQIGQFTGLKESLAGLVNKIKTLESKVGNVDITQLTTTINTLNDRIGAIENLTKGYKETIQNIEQTLLKNGERIDGIYNNDVIKAILGKADGNLDALMTLINQYYADNDLDDTLRAKFAELQQKIGMDIKKIREDTVEVLNDEAIARENLFEKINKFVNDGKTQIEQLIEQMQEKHDNDIVELRRDFVSAKNEELEKLDAQILRTAENYRRDLEQLKQNVHERMDMVSNRAQRLDTFVNDLSDLYGQLSTQLANLPDTVSKIVEQLPALKKMLQRITNLSLKLQPDTLVKTLDDNVATGQWGDLPNLRGMVNAEIHDKMDTRIQNFKDEILTEIYNHPNLKSIDPVKLSDLLNKMEGISKERLNEALKTVDEMDKHFGPLNEKLRRLMKAFRIYLRQEARNWGAIPKGSDPLFPGDYTEIRV